MGVLKSITNIGSIKSKIDNVIDSKTKSLMSGYNSLGIDNLNSEKAMSDYEEMMSGYEADISKYEGLINKAQEGSNVVSTGLKVLQAMTDPKKAATSFVKSSITDIATNTIKDTLLSPAIADLNNMVEKNIINAELKDAIIKKDIQTATDEAVSNSLDINALKATASNKISEIIMNDELPIKSMRDRVYNDIKSKLSTIPQVQQIKEQAESTLNSIPTNLNLPENLTSIGEKPEQFLNDIPSVDSLITKAASAIRGENKLQK